MLTCSFSIYPASPIRRRRGEPVQYSVSVAPNNVSSTGTGLKQNYFIVVLAHSLHGRLQRVHIPHRIVYSCAIAVAVMFLGLFGVAGSYARMLWKVSNYNSLQHEAELLRARYENLQKKVRQTNEQLASLQLLADEVSNAYGVRQQMEAPVTTV